MEGLAERRARRHAGLMEVRFLDAEGAGSRRADEVAALVGADEGFVWVDVPSWEADAEAVLEGLGCHPLVVAACRQRNYVPTVQGYADHVFVTTQSPFLGRAGHVHLLELDQIIGRRYLVTVHGPINPDVDPSHALVETDGVLARIEQGRFRPRSPAELSYAITSAVARRQSGVIREVAGKLPPAGPGRAGRSPRAE